MGTAKGRLSSGHSEIRGVRAPSPHLLILLNHGLEGDLASYPCLDP